MKTVRRACPICSCSITLNVTVVGERWLMRCAGCRHVFWRDEISEANLVEYYARTYTGTHNQNAIQQGERDYYASHMLELERWLRGPVRCLVDFGCSMPVCLEEAQRRGYARVVGVDFADEAIQAGRDAGLEMYAPSDFLSNFPEGGADVIRFSHVIEHMHDPLSELRQVVEKVAPRGIVYVTQPIFPALHADVREFPYKDAVFPEHLHFFNPISMLHLINECELDIEEFFAFQNVAHMRDVYEHAQDPALVEALLPEGIGIVPRGFDVRGGRPTFFGENCRLLARKR